MTIETLKTAQATLKYNASDMARALNTPLRTYQDWVAGVNRIPGVVAVAVRLLLEQDKWFLAELPKRVNALVDRDYPCGIPSEGP